MWPQILPVLSKLPSLPFGLRSREPRSPFHPLAKNSRVALKDAPEAALRGRKAGAVAHALQGSRLRSSSFICRFFPLRVLRGFIRASSPPQFKIAERKTKRKGAKAQGSQIRNRQSEIENSPLCLCVFVVSFIPPPRPLRSPRFVAPCPSCSSWFSPFLHCPLGLFHERRPSVYPPSAACLTSRIFIQKRPKKAHFFALRYFYARSPLSPRPCPSPVPGRPLCVASWAECPCHHFLRALSGLCGFSSSLRAFVSLWFSSLRSSASICGFFSPFVPFVSFVILFAYMLRCRPSLSQKIGLSFSEGVGIMTRRTRGPAARGFEQRTHSAPALKRAYGASPSTRREASHYDPGKTAKTPRNKL
jgi:hypothetical protein